MRFPLVLLALLLDRCRAFAPSAATAATTTTTTTSAAVVRQRVPALSAAMSEEERRAEILRQEALNPENMKASAAMMQNLTPDQIDTMLEQLDDMADSQFASMGMNKSMMKQSLEMMKTNPDMVQEMGKMMEKMTPEEMVERSKAAQQQMAAVMEPATTTSNAQNSETIVDTMYKVGELLSSTSQGVTRAAFEALPVIQLLQGTDDDTDLSAAEWDECWNAVTDGDSVDREGFGKVWQEVQEYFDDDIWDEARERVAARDKKTVTSTTETSTTETSTTSPQAPTVPTEPVVGSSIPMEQMQQELNKMSDKDMENMFAQMQDMTPEQEARLKAMGVDPNMMKKTASLMGSNPLMRNAAKAMMKNMSPDQMMQASQKAQEQMKNMSPEQVNNLMDDMEKK